jgi:Ca-activated chloride channel homolog
MFRPLLLWFLVWLPVAATPCDLALVLAVDVSGSVDGDEYRTQMDGLAAALQDGIVAEALVNQRAEVTLFQWSGGSRQVQSVPWTALHDFATVAALSETIAETPRAWRNFSTAIGEALEVSLNALEKVSHCRRKVIDLSGDGVSNEGIEPDTLRNRLRETGVVVNALAIETDDVDLTAYFFEHVIAGEGGFVITANGFEDYPAQIRRKLQRETIRQMSALELP